MTDQNTIIIIVIIIVVIALIYYLFVKPNPTTSEPFDVSQLRIVNPADEKNINVDVSKLPCHKSCYINQWPVPFDGLTTEQIQQKMCEIGKTIRR